MLSHKGGITLKLLKEEKGVTLIELLGVLAIFGLVSILLSGVLFSISKASAVQGQQVEFQQLANNMIAQMESISDISDLNKDATYYGKFNTPAAWKKLSIVKVMTTDMQEIQFFAQGKNSIALSDINDTLNRRARTYQVSDKKIKMKILQHKNENAVTKTAYSTPNYRDTFSIQTTGVILFYEEAIPFTTYYDDDSGLWDIEKLLATEEASIHYSRKFVYSYRDELKAQGEVPGNGRW